MLKLQQVIDALDKLAPWDWAESWDRVGLQIGDPDRTVAKVLVAVDLNNQVIEEGLHKKVDGFIVHHPLIFKPIHQINPKTPLGSQLQLLLNNNLFLIASHTNMDKSRKGINQFLAECFCLEKVEPIEPVKSEYFKVVTFSPEDYAAQIRQAMSNAGAGEIGEYTECSFNIKGTGTFKPNPGASPFIGQRGNLEEVNEIRLEMAVSKRNLARVIKALSTVHPYEEPAIDCYPLFDYLHKSPDTKAGLGRIGILPEPVLFEDLCFTVKERLAAKSLRITGDPKKSVSKMAICSGSGGSFVPAVIQKEADVYLTGELGYHDILTARENNLSVIEAGHWTTEYCFISLVEEYLKEKFFNEKEFVVLPSNTIQEEPYLNF